MRVGKCEKHGEFRNRLGWSETCPNCLEVERGVGNKGVEEAEWIETDREEQEKDDWVIVAW